MAKTNRDKTGHYSSSLAEDEQDGARIYDLLADHFASKIRDAIFLNGARSNVEQLADF